MTTPIIDRPPTFTEFANSPAPWLPDQPLWEQNAGSVGAVSALVAQDYPHVAEVVTFDPTVMPPKEQRAGDILLVDSTNFTTLFGGTDSLKNFWKNLATM